jgi:hypothetical protein
MQATRTDTAQGGSLDPLSTSRAPPQETEVSLASSLPPAREEGPVPCLGPDGSIIRLEQASGRGSVHGLIGSPHWAAPVMTRYCHAEARPGYAATLAHEYCDEEDVLRAKVDLLGRLLSSSRRCLLYTGAGLSTAAGIGDYATRDDSDGKIAPPTVFKSPILAQPTLAHHVLGNLCQRYGTS